MIMFGGSPHIVAEPPKFAQKTSAKIIGTGLNFNNLDNSMVTAARNKITVILSMNIASTKDIHIKAIKIGINFKDREKLYDRINQRVDEMLKNGLIEETRQVLNSNLSYTSVKAIGYKELSPYINGEKTLDECVEKLKRETRRYAKRQITWFKRDLDVNWLYADEINSFEELFDRAVQIINKG